MGLFEFLSDWNNLLHVSPVLLAGVFAISIIMERSKSLFKTYPLHDQQGFLDKISEMILRGQTGEAVALCEKYPKKPLAQITRAALVRAHLPEPMIAHGIEYALGEATHVVQKRTQYLATIANVATLLGLLGTIIGLIASFQAVAHADPQQKSALLAAGIGTALNATMLGLGVAIPAMVAYSFLVNKANTLVGELENSSVRIMEILKSRFYAVENFEGQSGNQGRSNVVSIQRAA